ncbi:hypothetical protein CEP88_18680 [Roseobacter denitrificans]|nr:tetratricopeptide repeat protein [Roseobacter denitrificans]AVL54419.1 hypothetical protein CEP88_18680 [Roseobacter denitrificans]SFG00645.1 hypothetical protein SAMN05443635_105218 [Roseobacter denitrificans OCh 114]
MSDTDSFIDEVNEEVRRDRFYLMLRRYGWVAALVVVLIVGGAAWSEYRKAQARAEAERLGDQILDALSLSEPATRQAGLDTIDTATPGAAAVVRLLSAAEAQQAGELDAALAALEQVAVDGDVPEIYRQIAAFKSIVLQADTMDPSERRQQLEALAVPGAPLSFLAQEQLALMEVAAGNTEAALAQYQSILQAEGASADLQQRALQVIVALGGTPELDSLPGLGN